MAPGAGSSTVAPGALADVTKGFAKAAASGALPEFSAVIASDKREASAQCAHRDEQSISLAR